MSHSATGPVVTTYAFYWGCSYSMRSSCGHFWWHVWATYHDAGAPCLVGAIVGADAALQLETQLVEQNMYRWLSWTALPQFHSQPPLLCKVTRIISTALIYCNHNCYHNRVLVPVEHRQTTLARLLSELLIIDGGSHVQICLSSVKYHTNLQFSNSTHDKTKTQLLVLDS